MMNTIRQNALEHDRSHGLIRETKWQLEHVRLEQHRLKDQEVEALDERSGITLLALENPEDGETQEVMRWVSEWIDKLQEAQGSYRDTEKRLSDTLLQFEVRKRQLAKKNEGYIDKLVRSGYVERRED
ncbi:hypothetical protein IMZ48_12995 [Candidatus Bathyarchaeota archaeon]|nr:hypothetical protein [Candidatus Bathyarchaeota archaeon]